MSHTNLVYPPPFGGGLSLDHERVDTVREDKDDYGAGLLELTDAIQGKLRTAEALAWVLHGSSHYPDGAGNATAAVIAELIHEAAEAHESQWQLIRRLQDTQP